MQKAEWIENRMRRLPKSLQQGRQCRFGGARAFRMPSHPVDDHQQHGLFGGGDRDSILIFVAMADQADVRGLDLQ